MIRNQADAPRSQQWYFRVQETAISTVLSLQIVVVKPGPKMSLTTTKEAK